MSKGNTDTGNDKGLSASGVSIAICAFNGLEYTKLLVNSIRRHSRLSHEILVYSDGSTDGTLDWLRSQGDIHWQHDYRNRGICTAMNRVSAMASRDYLFFPNTDHVLAPGWDSALQRHLSTRRVLSMQCIEPGTVPVASVFHAVDCGTRWDEFNEEAFHSAANRLSRAKVTPGVNYPFVISRALWNEVGGLDERFNPGPANDPDLFYRLTFAGAELVRLHDAIVYHFSGKSSRMADEAVEERREWQVVTARNEAKFAEKWGEEYRFANGGLPKPGPEAFRRWGGAAKRQVASVSSRLKAVIDSRCVGSDQEGIGLYCRNLIRSLVSLPNAPQIQCITANTSELRKAIPDAGNIIPLNIGSLPSEPAAANERLLTQIVAAGANVFHGPSFIVPSGSPVPTIATIHDLAFVHHPEWYPKGFPEHLDAVCREASESAHSLIVPSEFTRTQVLARYASSANKTHCIHESVPDEALINVSDALVSQVKELFAGGRDFILAVGVQQPRKNAVGLVKAFAAAVKKNDLPHALVLIGGADCQDPRLRDCIIASGLESRVHVFGRIPRDILSALYRSASVFAFPSLFEGFGLPPLEAMSQGVPVIASNNTALPEILGTAARLVDPENTEEVASAVEVLLSDAALRAELIHKGRTQVAKYSWQKAAEETLAVYEKSVSKGLIPNVGENKHLVKSQSEGGRSRNRGPLRVGIDARMLGAGTGTGRYSTEIIPRLLCHAKNADVVLLGPALLEGNIRGNIAHHVPVGVETLLDASWVQFSLPSHLLDCDVYFSPTGILPVARTCPGIAVVHGLSFVDRPDDFEPALKSYLETWVRHTCLSAERLIAVSEFTRDSLEDAFAIPRSRIKTIYHGKPAVGTPLGDLNGNRRASKRPSLLFVGSFEPNKCVPYLIEAFSYVAKRWPGDLVLAARPGRDWEAVKDMIVSLQLSSRVRIHVNPQDEELAKLYGSASLFVSPSTYESFCLPIVEAMSAGLPVVARAMTACPEVVGDGGILVHGPSPVKMAEAILELLTDTAKLESFGKAACARSEAFSWERATQATWAAIEECASLR